MTSPIGSSQGKWEYQSLTRVAEGPLLDALNEAGREGWELVNAAHYRDVQGLMAWTAILKRPLGQQSAVAPRRETAAAPIATRPTPKAAPTGKPREPSEEETEFELNVPAAAGVRPAARPRSPRPAPAKPRMELSDDFDFELATTTPVAQQTTKQTRAKAKQAVADDEFDFELGESFPVRLQSAKPQPPKPKAEPEDDTDFDLG
jgi:hypothetical protein